MAITLLNITQSRNITQMLGESTIGQQETIGSIRYGDGMMERMLLSKPREGRMPDLASGRA